MSKLFVVLFFTMFFNLSAVALGPYVSFEGAGKSALKSNGVRGEVSHSRFELNLLAPLPESVVPGTLAPQIFYAREFRTLKLQGDSPFKRADSVLNVGFVYITPVSVWGAKPLVSASLYMDPTRGTRSTTMKEFIVGAMSSEVPWRFSDDDKTSTKLLLRVRAYPGKTKFLPLFYHRIEMSSGAFIDLGIPSQLLSGWKGDDWMLYGGVRLSSRQYETETNGALGWIDGYTLALLSGARYHIAGPAFVSLEAGAQNETDTFFLNNATEHQALSSGFAPYFKLTLLAGG